MQIPKRKYWGGNNSQNSVQHNLSCAKILTKSALAAKWPRLKNNSVLYWINSPASSSDFKISTIVWYWTLRLYNLSGWMPLKWLAALNSGRGTERWCNALLGFNWWWVHLVDESQESWHIFISGAQAFSTVKPTSYKSPAGHDCFETFALCSGWYEQASCFNWMVLFSTLNWSPDKHVAFNLITLPSPPRERKPLGQNSLIVSFRCNLNALKFGSVCTNVVPFSYI